MSITTMADDSEDKELLRRSMRGMLPEEVRLRRKQPIKVDLLMAFYRRNPKPWLQGFDAVKELSRFVDVGQALECVKAPPPGGLSVHLRPVTLNFWLKWESQYAYKITEEEFRAQSC